MSLYIDTYFVLNLAVDYLALIATAKLRTLSVNRLKAGLSALLGAAYAVAAAALSIEFLNAPLIVLSVGALMLLLVFGGSEGLLRTALVFAGVSAAFGGFVLALQNLLGHLRLDMGVLLVAFPVCWLVLKLVFSGTASERPENAEILVEYNGKAARLKAMGDSGNLLHDPITGDAVVVASAEAVAPLLEPAAAEALRSSGNFCELLEKDMGKTKFRLIPYSAIGGPGMLAAFRPDRITVNGKRRKDLLVAVTSERISDTGAFDAVIGGAV